VIAYKGNRDHLEKKDRVDRKGRPALLTFRRLRQAILAKT
jgi:hypothetical protein